MSGVGRVVPRGAVTSTLRLGLINLKLVFGRAWWLYLFGLLVWVGLLVLWVVMGWVEEDWMAEDVQNGVITTPLLLLAIYLGMSSIASEIDDRTIEGVFTVSGSRYRPWIVRIATVVVFLAACDLLLAGCAWLFLVEFPFLGVALNALPAVLLYFALALMFSLLFKGAIPSGLTVVPILFFNSTFLLGATHGTRYNVFFNYLDRPVGLDEIQWWIMAVENRIGVLLIVGLVLFYTVRLTDKRERLLP